MWNTIPLLQMFLPRSWKWWITLDSRILNSPDTLRVLLIGFSSLAWNTVSRSTVLGENDLAWSSRFLQPMPNFFNFLVTVLLPFAQQMFLVCSVMAYLELVKNKFPNYDIFTFTCVTFKSHTKLSNAQRVSAPTNMILPTTAGTIPRLKLFVCMIYTLQLSTYQSIVGQVGWGYSGVRLPQRVSLIWWSGSDNPEALGNVEYPFIAITPKSTLARNGST